MFKTVMKFIKAFRFPNKSYSYYFLSLLYLYNITITYLDEPMAVTCNETTQSTDTDSEAEDIPVELATEVDNPDETEIVNLGDAENIKGTRISVHLPPSEKEEYIEFLKEYEDIFAWSYDNMAGLSTCIVAQKLPTDPTCPPVKQKL